MSDRLERTIAQLEALQALLAELSVTEIHINQDGVCRFRKGAQSDWEALSLTPGNVEALCLAVDDAAQKAQPSQPEEVPVTSGMSVVEHGHMRWLKLERPVSRSSPALFILRVRRPRHNAAGLVGAGLATPEALKALDGMISRGEGFIIVGPGDCGQRDLLGGILGFIGPGHTVFLESREDFDTKDLSLTCLRRDMLPTGGSSKAIFKDLICRADLLIADAVTSEADWAWIFDDSSPRQARILTMSGDDPQTVLRALIERAVARVSGEKPVSLPAMFNLKALVLMSNEASGPRLKGIFELPTTPLGPEVRFVSLKNILGGDNLAKPSEAKQPAKTPKAPASRASKPARKAPEKASSSRPSRPAIKTPSKEAKPASRPTARPPSSSASKARPVEKVEAPSKPSQAARRPPVKEAAPSRPSRPVKRTPDKAPEKPKVDALAKSGSGPVLPASSKSNVNARKASGPPSSPSSRPRSKGPLVTPPPGVSSKSRIAAVTKGKDDNPVAQAASARLNRRLGKPPEAKSWGPTEREEVDFPGTGAVQQLPKPTVKQEAPTDDTTPPVDVAKGDGSEALGTSGRLTPIPRRRDNGPKEAPPQEAQAEISSKTTEQPPLDKAVLSSEDAPAVPKAPVAPSKPAPVTASQRRVLSGTIGRIQRRTTPAPASSPAPNPAADGRSPAPSRRISRYSALNRSAAFKPADDDPPIPGRLRPTNAGIEVQVGGAATDQGTAVSAAPPSEEADDPTIQRDTAALKPIPAADPMDVDETTELHVGKIKKALSDQMRTNPAVPARRQTQDKK